MSGLNQPENNHSGSRGPQGNPQFKKPEFIIIDDAGSSSGPFTGGFQDFTGFNPAFKNKPVQYPFIVRLIFLLVSMCAFGWIVGLLLSLILFLAGCVITLFQVKKLNVFLNTSWQFLKTSLAVFSGALMGVFYPPFGLGVIALYFALQDKKFADTLIHRIFRNYINQ